MQNTAALYWKKEWMIGRSIIRETVYCLDSVTSLPSSPPTPPPPSPQSLLCRFLSTLLYHRLVEFLIEIVISRRPNRHIQKGFDEGENLKRIEDKALVYMKNKIQGEDLERADNAKDKILAQMKSRCCRASLCGYIRNIPATTIDPSFSFFRNKQLHEIFIFFAQGSLLHQHSYNLLKL